MSTNNAISYDIVTRYLLLVYIIFSGRYVDIYHFLDSMLTCTSLSSCTQINIFPLFLFSFRCTILFCCCCVRSMNMCLYGCTYVLRCMGDLKCFYSQYIVAWFFFYLNFLCLSFKLLFYTLFFT